MMTNFPLPYDNTQVTVELREVCKSVNIWDFEYPSYYKGAEKADFEQKVIDHYALRQIGQETVGRWLHYFRSRMREIMPYYIQLYESEALMKSIDDPFGNVDIKETFEEERSGERSDEVSGSTSETVESETTGTASGTTFQNNESTDVFSDTPQGNVDNLITHMTNVRKITEDKDEETNSTVGSTANQSGRGTSSSSSVGTETQTVKHTFTKKGNQGVNTYAHDMKELRETFLNIDLMVINELKDLFLQVY